MEVQSLQRWGKQVSLQFKNAATSGRVTPGIVFFVLVIVSIFGRLLPHPPNFAPVAGAALFAGFYFGRSWLAVAVPLATMIISDMAIGFYDIRIMATVYSSLAMPVLFGPYLKGQRQVVKVSASSVLSSLTFFFLTNLAVWAFGSMYDYNLHGLMRCYIAALPFFKYTLLGDAFWCATFFGSFQLCDQYSNYCVPSALRRKLGIESDLS